MSRTDSRVAFREDPHSSSAWVPMKPENLAMLPPQDRQEYENSLKITTTRKRYALRSRPY